MKLNRRYLRNIRENLSFYVASTILTVATLLMFYMFYISGTAILAFAEEFFPAHHLEDANFTTYLPLSEADIAELETQYDLTLEQEHYINLDTDGTTARVFQKTKELDLYEITVGRDIQTDDEIIISEGYAVRMEVALGDKLRIGDRAYTVTGYFQRPDYLYMLENEDDSYKNITTFFLAYMSDNAFQDLGESGCRYLVRYQRDNSTEFRKAVHRDFIMRSYLSKDENPRITMVDVQAVMFIEMAYVILVVMPLIAVVLICIIINRKVKSEQKIIGTLSALGYKRGQLMRHYAGFAALPGLIGGIATAILSMIFAQPYSQMGLQDYEPMRVQGHLSPAIAVLGILVPTAMYLLAGLLSVRRLLKRDTVALLSGTGDERERRRKRILAGSRLSFRVKYAVRSLIGNPARGFVVLLGVFLGGFIVLFGFSVFDSVQEMMDTAPDTVGSYQYQYILNELPTDNPYGGSALLLTSMETGDGSTLTLLGTDGDNPYLNFRDTSGNDVDIGDGYYISSLSAIILGLEPGDTLLLYNPLSLEKTEIVLSGVLQNDTMKAVFTSRDNAAEIIGVDREQFNALVSREALDIPREKVAKELRKSALEEQMQTIMDQMGFMIDLLIGLGVIICIASIYVAINMMVTENRNNISMLKVLGYRDRQIDRIVLDANHIFLPVGILLSIPAALAVCGLFYRMFAEEVSMLVTAYIAPRSYVTGILLTVGSYVVSLLLVRRKVKRVDMIECLKDNRE